MTMKDILIDAVDKETQRIFEEQGEAHLLASIDTPLKADAFDISDEEKIQKIEAHFKEILDIIGLDLNDDSLKGTPHRVAKMYVKEIFSGLNPANKPAMTLFDNKYQYDQMLIERNIKVQSTCEHHFLPIFGNAHVAYISSGKVIGLSKINRIVQYYAKRPQVQERMTKQILEELKIALSTEDVAVYVDSKHMCVASRGVQDINSSTITTAFSGKFLEESYRKEFFAAIQISADKY